MIYSAIIAAGFGIVAGFWSIGPFWCGLVLGVAIGAFVPW